MTQISLSKIIPVQEDYIDIILQTIKPENAIYKQDYNPWGLNVYQDEEYVSVVIASEWSPSSPDAMANDGFINKKDHHWPKASSAKPRENEVLERLRREYWEFRAIYLPFNKKCTLYFFSNLMKPLGLFWYSKLNAWFINNRIIPNIEPIIESNLQHKINLKYQYRFIKYIHQKNAYYYSSENEYKSLHEYLDLKLLDNNELIEILDQIDAYLNIMHKLGITHKNLTIDTIKLTIVNNPIKYKIYNDITQGYTYIEVRKYLVVPTCFNDVSLSMDGIMFQKYIKNFPKDISISLNDYYGLYDYNSFYLSLLVNLAYNDEYILYRNFLLNNYFTPLYELNKVKDFGLNDILKVEDTHSILNLSKYTPLLAVPLLGYYAYKHIKAFKKFQTRRRYMKNRMLSFLTITLPQKPEEITVEKQIEQLHSVVKDLQRDDVKVNIDSNDLAEEENEEKEKTSEVLNPELINAIYEEEKERDEICDMIKEGYAKIVEKLSPDKKLSDIQKNMVSEIIRYIENINEGIIRGIIGVLSKIELNNYEKMKFEIMSILKKDPYNVKFEGDEYEMLSSLYEYEKRVAVDLKDNDDSYADFQIGKLYDNYLKYYFMINDEVKLETLSRILKHGNYLLYKKNDEDEINPLFHNNRYSNDANILRLKNIVYIFTVPEFVTSFLSVQKEVYTNSDFTSKEKLDNKHASIEVSILEYLRPLDRPRFA